MSTYIIAGAVAIGLSSLGYSTVGVVAVMRAKREDIPAVVRALNPCARRIETPEAGISDTSSDTGLRAVGAPRDPMARQRFSGSPPRLSGGRQLPGGRAASPAGHV